MEIRLKQFYEVVRIEKGYNPRVNIVLNEPIEIPLLFHDPDTDAYYIASSNLNQLKENIDIYNNSIKDDDDYKWICKGCSAECKNRFRYKDLFFSTGSCQLATYKKSHGNLKTNWQKITNNEKIEIIEED